MGACESVQDLQQDQQLDPGNQVLNSGSLPENVVLAAWQRDEQNDSNRPSEMCFGKQNSSFKVKGDVYQQNHLNIKSMQQHLFSTPQKKTEPSQYSATNESIRTLTHSPQVFNSYSKYERTPLQRR